MPNPAPRFFVTGTGTGVGKTMVTALLTRQHHARAIKPVLSGLSDNDTLSDSALLLRSMSREPSLANIHDITPWRFSAPLSPHLAARAEGRTLSMPEITAFCRNQPGDKPLFIEGAGGLMSPLTDRETNLDLISALGYPVILVAGTYLGTLSHTFTAYETLRARQIPLHAIILSASDDAPMEDTATSLRAFLPHTPLHTLPRLLGDTPEAQWKSAPFFAIGMT